MPLDRQPPRCSKETERRGESQTERIHLPVETLQGSGTAVALRALKSLCGQSEVNKDTLICGNSSCLMGADKFMSLRFYHFVGQVCEIDLLVICLIWTNCICDEVTDSYCPEP